MLPRLGEEQRRTRSVGVPLSFDLPHQMSENYSFWTGAKELRGGFYARVSTHDQKTLALQLSAMRDYAKKRNWSIAIEVQDGASRATTHPRGRRSHRGGPPAAGWSSVRPESVRPI